MSFAYQKRSISNDLFHHLVPLAPFPLLALSETENHDGEWHKTSSDFHREWEAGGDTH
jgi:hypothetical protein